jgi:pantetheine-phosphate adenylyltransferase
MTKTAIFPGSFDPITLGHESIIRRALPLFDEIIVAIGVNSDKKYYFPSEKRKIWIEQVFAEEPRIKVITYNGLTIKLCQKLKANYILRGLRTSADFEFERGIAQMNKAMLNTVETVFILTLPELSAISSTIIRDILKHGGDVSSFVPKGINLNTSDILS